jgi:hypothetical protein
MAGKQIAAAMRQFQKLLTGGTVGDLTDDQLLARFNSQGKSTGCPRNTDCRKSCVTSRR